ENILVPNLRTVDYQRKNTQYESQFKMLKRLELPFNDFREISNYCQEIGITFLSTPGDKESADFLEEIGMPAFKIGSDDLDNLLLIRHVAKKRKPLIISTGMSNMSEVKATFDFVKAINDKIIFLHCTSNYPTKLQDVNLKAMLTMRRRLGTLIGYSDHTTNIWIPVVAASIGAKVIEKHMTIDRSLPGPDQKSSLDVSDFTKMVQLVRKAEETLHRRRLTASQVLNFVSKLYGHDINKEIKVALGSYEKKPTKSEKNIMKFVKKSIVAAVNIGKNEVLLEEKLAVKRAGLILPSASEYFKLVNRIAKRDIKKNEVITYEKLF
ncbi:MAG: N-acetylneuraminate synthase family protein, partial [Patescibacteria group bacterium]|nr:N-acetylneuraminate synthase family protein [Patescibacteria group bacterium]